MGKLFGGSTKTKTEEKTSTGPSTFQLPYLQDTFGGAKSIYDSKKGTPGFEGERYAGMTDAQKASLASLRDYAGTTGMDNANAMSGIGRSFAGSADKAVSNLDRFTSMAGEDANAANIAAASKYADNPYITGQIDASTRDISRGLREETLPGIDRSMSGSGNLNSSRAGVAAGIARRGAEDRMGDISASIRSDAYSKGLDLAQRDRAATMGAYGTAANAYSGMAGMGMDAMAKGNDAAYGAFDKMNQAGLLEQADRQGMDDAKLADFNSKDTREMDLLSRYAAITNGSQWGTQGTSSGTNTAKTGGNIFGQIAGAAATAASAFSDERLKTDIDKVGEEPDGLGIYDYRMKAGGPRQRGVMAQEVEKLRPWALGPKRSGFKTVNYDQL